MSPDHLIKFSVLGLECDKLTQSNQSDPLSFTIQKLKSYLNKKYFQAKVLRTKVVYDHEEHKFTHRAQTYAHIWVI